MGQRVFNDGDFARGRTSAAATRQRTTDREALGKIDKFRGQSGRGGMDQAVLLRVDQEGCVHA
jgi:hypothetical protein